MIIMVTCIINQFDCKAGTRGAADFKLSERVKLAKALTNKALGAVIAPIHNFDPIFVGNKKCPSVRLHVKKRSDSYKLLNGK